MGHDIGVFESYWRLTEHELLEDHLKAVPLLSIRGNNKLLEKQIEELTEKSKEENYMIKKKLSEKEKEIEDLRHNDKVKEDPLATLSDQVMKLMVEVQESKK
jgi:hypothetical protein